MADIITTPVELGFTEFVSKLISDTFEAIITSSARQEEDWMQLYDMLNLGLAEYAKKVITNDVLLEEVKRLFPDDHDGTTIHSGNDYSRGDPSKGKPETPPVFAITGYQPTGAVLQKTEVEGIFEAVRQILAARQYEVLKSLFARGTTKVVVDSGKINAKLTFNITQVDEADASPQGAHYSKGGTSAKSSFPEAPVNVKQIILKKGPASFLGITRPTELQNVHFFVKPPSDKDPQTSKVSANVYSEVEIQFKTIT